MTDRELMQQSLDALEGNDLGLHYRTIDALRAALAAPVEPVRELLIQAAALAVVAERQGKYPGAAQVADEVLKAQPAIDGFGGNLDSAFDAAPAVRGRDERAAFEAWIRKDSGDLTFHDGRATALTLLARRVDLLTLARISQHSDLRMLQRYYRESSADIAARI